MNAQDQASPVPLTACLGLASKEIVTNSCLILESHTELQLEPTLATQPPV